MKFLASRVQKLEEDMHEMRTKMVGFGEDLSALRTTVKHVDERTLRGEKLMGVMQGEQRHMSRVVDAIAEKLQVVLPPNVVKICHGREVVEVGDDDLDHSDPE